MSRGEADPAGQPPETLRPDQMSPDEFRRWGHETVEWIARYMEKIEDFPVLSQVAPGDIRAEHDIVMFHVIHDQRLERGQHSHERRGAFLPANCVERLGETLRHHRRFHRAAEALDGGARFATITTPRG